MLSRFRQKRPGTPLGQMLFYEIIRRSVRILFGITYRLRVRGLEHLPPTGAVLIVANHQSFLDPPAIGSAVGVRHLDFVARLGLFQSSRPHADLNGVVSAGGVDFQKTIAGRGIAIPNAV